VGRVAEARPAHLVADLILLSHCSFQGLEPGIHVDFLWTGTAFNTIRPVVDQIV
jgi:hypothetical protein